MKSGAVQLRIKDARLSYAVLFPIGRGPRISVPHLYVYQKTTQMKAIH